MEHVILSRMLAKDLQLLGDCFAFGSQRHEVK
jgi:hypothetical protein